MGIKAQKRNLLMGPAVPAKIQTQKDKSGEGMPEECTFQGASGQVFTTYYIYMESSKKVSLYFPPFFPSGDP